MAEPVKKAVKNQAIALTAVVRKKRWLRAENSLIGMFLTM
jgi:hypothetical protein